MEAKYTLGPWVASQTIQGQWKVYDGHTGLEVADIGPRKTKEETKANAHLLAATPEMLEVLEGALLAAGWGIQAPIPEDMRYSVPSWVYRARAVVAKAKGQNPPHRG